MGIELSVGLAMARQGAIEQKQYGKVLGRWLAIGDEEGCLETGVLLSILFWISVLI